MIQVNDLCVTYKSKQETIQALGPVSLTIKQGDIYAIIGPSGCGKSTLLNVLSGLIQNYDGTATINNVKLNPKAHKIGLIPQNFGLLPWQTVYQNCVLAIKIKGIKIDDNMEKRITYIMKKLNIEHLKNRYPKELSGGQQQRVAIARAFILNPDLLLMDEPFSALDALTREEAQALFLDMLHTYETTTVFVTHNIDEAIYMGKKIIMLSKNPGVIVEIIDNPLFNVPNMRETEAYGKLCTHIRHVIKKGWV
ncbi:MAG TPA: nitrate/sulfonate/bicarbonate ABC transporter ATP-binding protein [Firmicutes bacterium]|nr:nitrate/sulfonate/bicarbonate ABC transporter ATP-binding protein [Bacillota bacterium]